jgi:hypothetical protein
VHSMSSRLPNSICFSCQIKYIFEIDKASAGRACVGVPIGHIG